MGTEKAGLIIKKRSLFYTKKIALLMMAALLLFPSACVNTGVTSASSLNTSAVAEPNPKTGDSSDADKPARPDSTPFAATEGNEEVSAEPLSALNEEYILYGSMTIEGMKRSDYDMAMSTQWTRVDTPGEPVPYDAEISDLLNYEEIEEAVLNLGRYDGVDIFVIGQSEQGRNIYMVKLNLSGSADGEAPLIMLTGGVHAREFAGTDYMLKFLSDTLQKAQNDVYTRALLQNVTIAAVPLVNPDGRELIVNGGNRNRKSNANGVDLNRAMPSVNAGQLASGVKRVKDFSKTPGMDFFAGYSLGTESETRAMIKWFNTYVPQAAAYIDLHQQGGSAYCDKPFASEASDAACRDFAKKLSKLLKKGYPSKHERKHYGLDGDGGTLTDYARSIAEGFAYSCRLGRMALVMDGVETPLISFRDIDDCMAYYQPVNAAFLSATLEIGRTRRYLGPSQSARNRREKEYNKYRWKNFLTGTIEIVLGEEKVNEIKSGL